MLLLPLRSNCGLFLSSLFSVLFSRSFLYSCSWRILHLVQFQSCTRKLIHSAVLTVHHCFGLCLQRTERRSAASALPKLRISAQSAALPLQRLSSKCVSAHRAPLCRFNDFHPSCVSAHRAPLCRFNDFHPNAYQRTERRSAASTTFNLRLSAQRHLRPIASAASQSKSSQQRAYEHLRSAASTTSSSNP